MPKIRIHTNSARASLRLKKALKKRQAKVRGAVEATAFEIEGVAKRLAPVNDGELRASIGILRLSSDGLSLDVGTNKEYAFAIEKGRGPGHWPPIKAFTGEEESLDRWVEKKIGDPNATFLVARKIFKEGTDPQPFMEPAAERARPAFKARIIKALQ